MRARLICICYAPTSKTSNSRIARQPRILFSLLSAQLKHACFRGWRALTRQSRSIANLILLAVSMNYIFLRILRKKRLFFVCHELFYLLSADTLLNRLKCSKALFVMV
jgi:hypothetical protein